MFILLIIYISIIKVYILLKIIVKIFKIVFVICLNIVEKYIIFNVVENDFKI